MDMDIDAYLAYIALGGGYFCIHCYSQPKHDYWFHCTACLDEHHRNNRLCTMEEKIRLRMRDLKR